MMNWGLSVEELTTEKRGKTSKRRREKEFWEMVLKDVFPLNLSVKGCGAMRVHVSVSFLLLG